MKLTAVSFFNTFDCSVAVCCFYKLSIFQLYMQNGFHPKKRSIRKNLPSDLTEMISLIQTIPMHMQLSTKLWNLRPVVLLTILRGTQLVKTAQVLIKSWKGRLRQKSRKRTKMLLHLLEIETLTQFQQQWK